MAGRMIPVGRLAVATPASMALAIRNTTEAQKAVDERILPVAAEIIGGLPSVEAAARNAVDGALQSTPIVRAGTAFVPVGDEVGGLVDKDDRGVRASFFDALGRPAFTAVAAMSEKGVLTATDKAGINIPANTSRLIDEAGREAWVGIGPDGGPDATAKWAIVNAVGFYYGTDIPFVWPGNRVKWERPLGDGTSEYYEGVGE